MKAARSTDGEHHANVIQFIKRLAGVGVGDLENDKILAIADDRHATMPLFFIAEVDHGETILPVNYGPNHAPEKLNGKVLPLS